MLKRNITFENLDGEMVTKEFHFNLAKNELIRLETEHGENGFQEAMKQIVDSKDGRAIMDNFERIIMMTVGERQGDQFVKNDEIKAAFRNCGAYDELFTELVTDAEAGARFINGVVPAHIAEKVKNMPRPGQPQDYLPKDKPAEKPVELQTAPPQLEAESLAATPPTNAFEAPQPAVPTNVPPVPEQAPVQVPTPEQPPTDEQVRNWTQEELERNQVAMPVANGDGGRFSIQDFSHEEIAAADRANALRRDQRDPRDAYRSQQ